jgi:hypothetical protein
VFAAPDRYVGTKVNLVGDLLTVPEMREEYRRTTGTRAWGWALPTALARRLNEEFTEQLEWQRDVGFLAEPAEARAVFPGMQDLRTHLQLRAGHRAASTSRDTAGATP